MRRLVQGHTAGQGQHKTHSEASWLEKLNVQVVNYAQFFSQFLFLLLPSLSSDPPAFTLPEWLGPKKAVAGTIRRRQ